MYLNADFFEIWGGSLVVVEYKRLLEIDDILNVYYDIQSTRSEIMTRTDYAKRILAPDMIPSIEIQVIEIKGSSITFDSPHFTAPKGLPKNNISKSIQVPFWGNGIIPFRV